MRFFSSFLLVFLTFGCESSKSTYAVLGHTRLSDNSGIDSTVAKACFSNYDMLLLGGDMANLSSYNDSIMHYLNDVFDISNSKTLWALGNHDYTDLELLNRYTKKETFYTYCQDKTVFIVLDTQRDSSKIIGEQLDFFNSIMDTVSDSKNIVLLTHKLIWMRGNVNIESQANSISNGELGNCSYCIQANNFYSEIYPRLVDFRNGNGQVYCVAGDVGFNSKKYEYKTEEGIQFLATGIKANSKANCFLLLSNDLSCYEISFEFLDLEKL